MILWVVWSKEMVLGAGPGQAQAAYFCCCWRGCGVAEVQPLHAVSSACSKKYEGVCGLQQSQSPSWKGWVDQSSIGTGEPLSSVCSPKITALWCCLVNLWAKWSFSAIVPSSFLFVLNKEVLYSHSLLFFWRDSGLNLMTAINRLLSLGQGSP